jgi:hypothetical protein
MHCFNITLNQKVQTRSFANEEKIISEYENYYLLHTLVILLIFVFLPFKSWPVI